jgi:hypothetical protein
VPVAGNAGSLPEGYFIPAKSPAPLREERKPRVLLKQY